MRAIRLIVSAAIGLVLAVPARAQVVANSQSGTADFGTASKAIANVVATDTVNGAPATLGAGGNAIVSLAPPLQKGIVLNTTTGALTTTATTPAATYTVNYQLCDAANPSSCNVAPDTVIVRTPPTLVANPDSGSATAGVATTVVNVIANDTVNGAPAVLGKAGNATIAQGSGWPPGITLTTTTGAVKTAATQLPGPYPLSYTLCDQNTPDDADCVTGSVTVTINAAIATLPIAGSAVVNMPGIPIEDVAIPDTVNGVAATFGASGNATVTQGPNWQAGFTLNTSTGEIDSDGTPPLGTYTLPYTLCDLNSPPDCATQNATVAITNQFMEQQATQTPMGDVEFDWGRDGVPCATCNFGDGNDRANWTDRQGNIWIAHLDITTGAFISPQANDELADTTAYFWKTWGNGPEWAFSTQNGQIVSQLVYSRWQPGQPAQPQPGAGYAGAAYTTQTGYNDYNNGVGNNWQPHWLPGAVNAGDGQKGSNNSNLPEASQCNTDSYASVVFKNFVSPLQLFTEYVNSIAGNEPLLLPLPSGVTSNGIGERFVPCTTQMLYQANVPYGATGQTAQQVFWYDWVTGVTEQLTTDPVDKFSGFMFKAPDFGDNYIFYTVSQHKYIEVFEQTGPPNANGSPNFQLVNTIYSPLLDQQYLNTSEPFINCTPTCTTYAFITISSSKTQQGIRYPNGLAVVALNPATPLFYTLVSADAPQTRQRLDPEYFITPQGPYLYYNRIIPLQPGQTQYQNTGEWFIDMQLGAPSGLCVGSSAEDGLPSGC
jgi:hypothetical protein